MSNTKEEPSLTLETSGLKFYRSVKDIKEEAVKKALEYYEIAEAKSIILIDEPEDFYKLLHFYSFPRNPKKEKYVFRGISNPAQKYCTFHRYIKKEGYSCFYKRDKEDRFYELFNREIEFIRKFEQNALSSLPACLSTSLDLIAAAQHYGLPTRLLDWSTSLLIATLFSLHNENIDDNYYYAVFAVNKNDYSTLYNLPFPQSEMPIIENINSTNYILYEKMLYEFMDAYDSNDKGVWAEYLRRSLSASYTRTAFNSLTHKRKSISAKARSKKLIFLETNFSNTRITSQRGLFQIIPEMTEKYANEYVASSNLILISAKCRRSIIWICQNLGLNFYALMPDTQSVADNIKGSMYRLHRKLKK